jgi:uncharacterized protein YdeI (YjbR/CyaY-like superfamily)
VIPDKTKIQSFPTQAAFERWLSRNHDRETELWLKIFKKNSGVNSVTNLEAIEVALCWGWIDGIRKGLDEKAFLQRFTPRTKKSIWSQINRDHVARLTAAGRMTPHGQRQIDAAKADGRWGAAYAPMRTASADTLPADLLKAIAKNPKAQKTLKTLSKLNLFALAFRTNNMRTPDGRARKIAEFVATLARGEDITSRPPRARTAAKRAKPAASPKR